MWSSVASVVVGLAGVLAAANLLSSRRARSVRRLHALAEAVAVLPDGPGRRELNRIVDEEASALAAELQRGPRWPSVVVLLSSAGALIGGGVLLAYDSISGAVDGHETLLWWLQAVAFVGCGAALVSWIAVVIVPSRFGTRR